MKKTLTFTLAVLFSFTVLLTPSLLAAPAHDDKDHSKVVKKTSDDPIVYVKEGGKKYHKKNCGLVATGKKGIKLSEAIKAGYEPCKVCQPPAEMMVFVNPNGKKFHKKGCTMIKKDAKTMSLADAQKEGFEPCKLCHIPDKKEKK